MDLYILKGNVTFKVVNVSSHEASVKRITPNWAFARGQFEHFAPIGHTKHYTTQISTRVLELTYHAQMRILCPMGVSYYFGCSKMPTLTILHTQFGRNGLPSRQQQNTQIINKILLKLTITKYPNSQYNLVGVTIFFI